MATWKKVIVSGSNAVLNQLEIGLNQITTNPATTFLTGSFSGSFSGVTNLPDLTESTGITPFIYDGSGTATVAVSGAAQLTNDIITKWNTTDGKFVDSSLTDNGTTITGATSIQLTGANSVLTGSFSGSFTGTTDLPDLTESTGITAFTYDGSTTATIAVSGASSLTTNTVTKWTGTAFADSNITDGTQVQIGVGASSGLSVQAGGITVTGDSTFNDNVIISGDLTVAGTASFQNVENLLVADRFILLASGSNTTGDGGLVVQQGTQNVGELFGFDSATTRWAVTSSYNAASSSFTPDAFMAAVVEGTGGLPTGVEARYEKKGNLFIGNDETIWIYS